MRIAAQVRHWSNRSALQQYIFLEKTNESINCKARTYGIVVASTSACGGAMFRKTTAYHLSRGGEPLTVGFGRSGVRRSRHRAASVGCTGLIPWVSCRAVQRVFAQCVGTTAASNRNLQMQSRERKPDDCVAIECRYCRPNFLVILQNACPVMLRKRILPTWAA